MPYPARHDEDYADRSQDRVVPGTESFRVGYDDLPRDRCVVGSAEDCVAALLPWRDELGVEHVVLRTDRAGTPVEAARTSLHLLAREVVPALRAPSLPVS